MEETGLANRLGAHYLLFKRGEVHGETYTAAT
jgi:hypothetical protein